jgi:hypothetical protein
MVVDKEVENIFCTHNMSSDENEETKQHQFLHTFTMWLTCTRSFRLYQRPLDCSTHPATALFHTDCHCDLGMVSVQYKVVPLNEIQLVDD